MKKLFLSMTLMVATLVCSAQGKSGTNFGMGDIKIHIEEGEEWKHDFPLFLFVKLKVAPQIAVWVEDMNGNYLSTIYVSKKLAKQKWMMSGGARRKEALPVWSHAQGNQYDDGLYLPTKKEPLADAYTGATPKGSFTANLQADEQPRQFIIKCEFNHSVDFTEDFPKSAKEGDANYTGGKLGSGQPAVVYQVVVDLDSNEKEFKGEFLGHSSIDGSDGNIYPDVSKLTTALKIVKEIAVSL